MGIEIKGKKNPANVEAKEKNAAVVAAEAPVEAVDTAKLGSLSDKLKFVAALGDPSQDDVTYGVDANGKKTKQVDPIIVGYRFVADVDLEVPDVMPGEDLKKNLMSFTGDTTKTRLVKAGTEFDLTKFETGALISREEFNARATGGQIPVLCSYVNTSKKTSTGAVAQTTAAASIPTISIRAITGSIKDVAIIPVLKFTATKDPQTNVTRKEREILPGFEKWQALCIKQQTRSGRTAGASTPANVRNAGAAAFLRIAQAQAKKN